MPVGIYISGFLIFGKFIGDRIGPIQGVSYMAFIVPGLIMMAVINSAYSNVVGSFFSAKFLRSIEELLVSPASDMVILAGYVSGGVLRGLLVGFLVFGVSVFFAHPVIMHFFLIGLFIFLTAVVFALVGLVNAIFAKSFDDISIFPTFILTPLTYLGGVFYSIRSLLPFWENLSRLNPGLSMVNGFRYGFYGFSDVPFWGSVTILLGFVVVLAVLTLALLKKGVGLRT